MTTLLARRSRFHPARLAEAVTPGSASVLARLTGIARALEQAGSASAEATHRAYGALYRQLFQQPQTLAYLDAFPSSAGSPSRWCRSCSSHEQ